MTAFIIRGWRLAALFVDEERAAQLKEATTIKISPFQAALERLNNGDNSVQIFESEKS